MPTALSTHLRPRPTLRETARDTFGGDLSWRIRKSSSAEDTPTTATPSISPAEVTALQWPNNTHCIRSCGDVTLVREGPNRQRHRSTSRHPRCRRVAGPRAVRLVADRRYFRRSQVKRDHGRGDLGTTGSPVAPSRSPRRLAGGARGPNTSCRRRRQRYAPWPGPASTNSSAAAADDLSTSATRTICSTSPGHDRLYGGNGTTLLRPRLPCRYLDGGAGFRHVRRGLDLMGVCD